MSNSVRTQVIKTICHIQNGLSLSNMLDGLLDSVASEDKSFTHNLLLTTLRHWYATSRLLDSLADKPIDEIEVRTAIQLGITQIIYLEVANHASIFETVEAVKEIGFSRATGLVNAILRKVSKNPSKYRKQCDKKHSLPNWLAKQIKQDWKENYDLLCKGLRNPAPMFLRVNNRISDTDKYLKILTEYSIPAKVKTIELSLEGSAQSEISSILLDKPQSATKLPQFDEGAISVQDIHASIAGKIIKEIIEKKFSDSQKPPCTQLDILDACTAPSGKLIHCLESFSSNQVVKVKPTKVGIQSNGNDKLLLQHEEHSNGKLKFTAIDNESKRLQKSNQNLERTNLIDEVKLICADATTWVHKDNQKFDIILLDAPCTATGVIRRHPDITLLRKQDDIEQTVELQKNILDNLWAQLKLNGYLIYATCSILKSENEQQMLSFFSKNDVKELKIDGNWGIPQEIGRQCLPIYNGDIQEGDGFYYAILQKIAN